MILRLPQPFRFGALCFTVFALTTGRIHAQTQEVDRAQLFRGEPTVQVNPYTPENGDQNGVAAASPNDPDIGEQLILKRVQFYQPWIFSAAVPFYYTSNVALSRRDEKGDVLAAPVASISYVPRITQTLFADISVQQQFFCYDKYSELNFGSFDAKAGFTYLLPQWHNLSLRAEYDYNRLTTSSDLDELFSNHSLYVSAELPFRFGRAQQLSLGSSVGLSLYGNPEKPRRDDYEVYVGYAVNLTRALAIDGVARVAVRDYVIGDRTDVSEILALSANYRLAKWLTASAISTLAWNQSNHSVFDYKVANVGGAVALTVKF